MCKKVLIMAMVFAAVVIGIGGYGSCMAGGNYVVLEDAEDGNAEGWSVTSGYGRIENAYDDYGKSRTIRVIVEENPNAQPPYSPAPRQTGFCYTPPKVALNSIIEQGDSCQLQWSMRGSFWIFDVVKINLVTTAGSKTLSWDGKYFDDNFDSNCDKWTIVNLDLTDNLSSGETIRQITSIEFITAGIYLDDIIMLSGEETPWKSNENGALATDTYWPNGLTGGYNFTPQRNGVITKLGGYFNGTKKVYLWDSNKKLLASADVTSSNNWSYADINPVQVIAGSRYTVVAFLGQQWASYRSHVTTLPQRYGDITIENCCYNSGEALPPTSTRTDIMYGQVDIGFIPGVCVEQTPWKSNENGSLYVNTSWQYGMAGGYDFTPQRNGVITKLGGYFNGTKKVYLWDSNKKLLASADVTSSNNWSYAYIISDNVEVEAGKRYKVGVFFNGGPLVEDWRTGASCRANVTTLPQTYGDITIENSCYTPYYNPGHEDPPTGITGWMYGQVDIGFIPGVCVEQTPWKSNENGTLATNAYFQKGVTLGYNFIPQKNGVITRLGGCFNGTTIVYLWDADKNVIASTEVTSNNNWSYADISPTQVTAGRTYTIAAYLGPSAGVSYRSNIETLPKTYQDITIENSCYDIGNVLPPTHIRRDGMSGQVDIGFIPLIGEIAGEDVTPPTTPVVTDGGSSTENFTQLHATWSSSDTESGISEYQYAIGREKGGTNVVNWTSTGTATEVTKTGLSLGWSGTYYFSVKAKNGAGAWSSEGYSDGICAVDFTAPTGTISINNGAANTASKTVTLNLSATDTFPGSTGTGVSKMKFSNDNITWSEKENYATTKPWTLTSGGGRKTVYVKFVDAICLMNDNAGNWSQAISDTIILDTTDTTPPTTPVVTDDGTYTTSKTQLHAKWSSSDSESGIAQYQYAIGTTAGGTNIVNWTSTGTTASVTKTGLSLTNGATYYFSVKSKNGSGLYSAIGKSNGIKVDATAPTTPVVTDDGTYTTSKTQLHAKWSSSDSESGIAQYQYAIGTTAGGTDIVNWTSTGTIAAVTKTGLSLTNGATYYFSVKSKNGSGLYSAIGKSNGIKVDATAPTTPVVTDDGTYTTSKTQLHAKWSSSDSESGIAQYQYAIGTTAGGTDIVNWTSTGTIAAVTKTGLSLTNGATYYFSVKSKNGSGLYSAIGKSNGIKVQ